MNKFLEKISYLVEHDIEGRYGEACEGEYECVCGEKFRRYRMIDPTVSMKDVTAAMKAESIRHTLYYLNKVHRANGMYTFDNNTDEYVDTVIEDLEKELQKVKK